MKFLKVFPVVMSIIAIAVITYNFMPESSVSNKTGSSSTNLQTSTSNAAANAAGTSITISDSSGTETSQNANTSQAASTISQQEQTSSAAPPVQNQQTTASGNTTVEPEQKQEVKPEVKKSAPSAAIPDIVEKNMKKIDNSEISIDDYMKIAGIAMKKLSVTEMKQLFDSTRDDYWVTTSVEDIKKAREILFSKLGNADLNTLREIGKKYGHSMEIINPNLDVEKIKSEQIATWQAKQNK